MVIYLPSQSVDEEPALDELTPREIVRELDKYVESMLSGMGRVERRAAMAGYVTGLLLDRRDVGPDSQAGWRANSVVLPRPQSGKRRGPADCVRAGSR